MSLPPRCQASATRSGFTLVELLVVISTVSVMLLAGVGIVHLLMRVEREGVKDVWYGQSLSRLADVWRRDVHAARELRADVSGDSRVVLRLPNNDEIAYVAEGAEITRTFTQANVAAHRDTFRFPSGSKIRIDVGEPKFLRLIIDRQASADPLLQKASQRPGDQSPMPAGAETALASGRVTVIEAGLSRDLKYRTGEAARD